MSSPIGPHDDGNGDVPESADSTFHHLALRAGAQLRDAAVGGSSPSRVRRRLARIRIATSITAVVVVGAASAAVLNIRSDDRGTRVAVVSNGSSTSPATLTTASATSKPTSTTHSIPKDSIPTTLPVRDVPRSLVTVVDGKIVILSRRVVTTVAAEPSSQFALRTDRGIVVQYADRVVILATAHHSATFLAAKRILGLGTFGGPTDLVMLGDATPTADGKQWVWVYDLVTRSMTRTGLYSVPGARFDHVSFAGDVYVLSGVSAEGGPFVLYRRSDGSFADGLASPPADHPGLMVSNAAISPDERRIVYLVDGTRLVVTDLASGVDVFDVVVSTKPVVSGTVLDYDGRWVVISGPTAAARAAARSDVPLLIDTQAKPARVMRIDGAHGIATLDRAQ